MEEPHKPFPGAVPPPVRCGFVLLLARVFTASYAGGGAGPVVWVCA
ncbi:hypothetical protein [Streptomyces sp. NPDC051001]